MLLKDKIRIIEDFPKKGISFKDVTPLLIDGKYYKECTRQLCEQLKDKDVDLILAPEARGFIFGTTVAYELGIGFVPVRKEGKLPFETEFIEYELEYGKDKIEIHKDAIKKGQKVAVVDDLLATGGTVDAIVKLVERMGGEVVSLNFVVELTDLNAREKLKGYNISSLVKYNI
ncbi:adenine phosphoribosyltransferase [Hathewaya histolytica]|uniref:Adenine phosphoribosyltransferase n=1 Tax=Hathewaya histolytica TaxID=1498 RepID=A0A4V6KDY2_HATHI|nr:adenine phosphoribosyltransferase [Hathewaya histolytica]VTQ92457.1 adenine phosphoribosyltransferase Apt [Hathewaya histolytica]